MQGWLVLQLADSAFPTGGFAHSGGLEAAAQLGEVVDGAGLDRFLRASTWQAGRVALPFVNATHDDPASLPHVDAVCDAFLTGSVANRASRTQGRALVATCARVFAGDAITALDAAARSGTIAAHLAPAFGATMRALGVERGDAQRLFLHLAQRGVTSAGVRLGIVGPHEAQRMQHAHAPLLARVLDACARTTLDDVAQPAPLVELIGQTQDRLYSKLFQS